jgi:cyclophilin family peptidyl-prolyl cis-trans isomerase
MKNRIAVLIAFAAATTLAACGTKHAPLLSPSDKRFAKPAPDSFDVEFITTKGRMLVRAHREWSPNGVDRFYALAANNYFDTIAFYRTVPNFVSQFGYHGDTAISHAWNQRTIPDDPVKITNKRGTLVFARSGPNTRSTQFFFNIVDNAYLDDLNGIGFPPIGEIIQGVEVLDKLNGEYGNTPNNGRPPREGNAYLRREFPNLDYITRARVVKAYKR